MPLEERKEFVEDFRNKVGVPDRDCKVRLDILARLTGLREGALVLGEAEGVRPVRGFGYAFELGDVAKRVKRGVLCVDAGAAVEIEGEVERESLFRESKSSRSSSERFTVF